MERSIPIENKSSATPISDRTEISSTLESVMPPVCGPINIPEIIYPNISGKRRR
jgi:hypothetical protein